MSVGWLALLLSIVFGALFTVVATLLMACAALVDTDSQARRSGCGRCCHRKHAWRVLRQACMACAKEACMACAKRAASTLQLHYTLTILTTQSPHIHHRLLRQSSDTQQNVPRAPYLPTITMPTLTMHPSHACGTLTMRHTCRASTRMSGRSGWRVSSQSSTTTLSTST